MSGNVCLATEKTSFFRAGPKETDGTLGGICLVITQKLKNGGRAGSVIKHTGAEYDGVVMRGINDDLVGLFRTLDLCDDVLRIALAFFLCKRELDFFGLGGNKLQRVGHADTNAGELAVFNMLRAEHTFIEVKRVFGFAERTVSGNKSDDTCFDECFEGFGTKTLRHENNLTLYVNEIDGIERFQILEFRFDTVCGGVACEAVACYLVLLVNGSRYFQFGFFDLVSRCLEAFDRGLDAERLDLICNDLCALFLAFKGRKTNEIHFFEKLIHSLSANVHENPPINIKWYDSDI